MECDMIEHYIDDDQEELTIDKDIFVADSEMAPLLRELNRLGLETTQHCSGHGERESYLSIKLKPVELKFPATTPA